MPDAIMNEMHGPHCEGKYKHCSCNECHGRPPEAQNYAPNAREECGCHCIGHYCEKCEGVLSQNSNIHCRCNACHNIPDISLSHLDRSISFEKAEN